MFKFILSALLLVGVAGQASELLLYKEHYTLRNKDVRNDWQTSKACFLYNDYMKIVTTMYLNNGERIQQQRSMAFNLTPAQVRTLQYKMEDADRSTERSTMTLDNQDNFYHIGFSLGRGGSLKAAETNGAGKTTVSTNHNAAATELIALTELFCDSEIY